MNFCLNAIFDHTNLSQQFSFFTTKFYQLMEYFSCIYANAFHLSDFAHDKIRSVTPVDFMRQMRFCVVRFFSRRYLRKPHHLKWYGDRSQSLFKVNMTFSCLAVASILVLLRFHSIVLEIFNLFCVNKIRI